MSRAKKVEAWTRASVRALKPYYKAPLEGSPLRLDQNTNLFGANPAIGAVDARGIDYTQYPTRDGDALLDALSLYHGLDEAHFTLGNGSDESLDLLVKTFCEPGDTLAVTQPTYSLYPFYAALQDLKLAEVPLDARFGLDVDGLLDAGGKVTLVASPNNPTGNRFRDGELRRLIEEADGIVVVDEAYIEYAGHEHSLLDEVERHDNLIIMRTFSKAHGLAGLRIGYLVANRELSARLRVVKPPFNLNTYSEAVAAAALQDDAWMRQGVLTVMEERERLAAALHGRGFHVFPSDANFLLTRPPAGFDAGHLADGLRRRSILARTFAGKPRLHDLIRFTVGGPEHSDALLAALDAILKEAR
ncbi:MAG: histidinol-phosphate transaminase [Thermoplasmatota archaeon]